MTHARQSQAAERSSRAALLLSAICDVSENAPGVEEKLALLKDLPGDMQMAVARSLMKNLADATRSARDQDAVNQELHQIVQKLTQDPWHVAIFKRWVDVGERKFARVFCGGEERLVAPVPDLDTQMLGAGATVFLTAQRNALLSCDPEPATHTGQLGKVSAVHENGAVVVAEHDLELTLERAHWLSDREIGEGDQIVWCPRTQLVLDVVKSSRVAGVERIAVEIDEPPPLFAGYEEVRDDVIAGFLCGVANPDLAARYGITPAEGALLLHGPSGCGKTLLVRNLAHELNASLFVINATAIYSPWVGESEQRLIETFRKAQEAAPALLYIDEIDAIGRVRGGLGQQHSDRVASVLLTQMDGAAGTPGIGIVGACNRVDLLDPALRSRFGRQFQLRPPRRAALRQIAEVHLAPKLPYRKSGTRERCIDTLVNRLTSPNADNQIATLQMRDGKTRAVCAADLLSGRAVKQIVESASEAAFRREAEGGVRGIDVRDVELAVERAVMRWRDTLCVANVRGYLNDLPDDVDVVSVDPVVNVARPSEYLAAGA